MKNNILDIHTYVYLHSAHFFITTLFIYFNSNNK